MGSLSVSPRPWGRGRSGGKGAEQYAEPAARLQPRLAGAGRQQPRLPRRQLLRGGAGDEAALAAHDRQELQPSAAARDRLAAMQVIESEIVAFDQPAPLRRSRRWFLEGRDPDGLD